MNISCPICDTSIEVSKFLVGQKGRCPNCASKFIIPESPDDEMEVLEKGEIPAKVPEPVPPPPAPEQSEKKSAEPPKISSPSAKKRTVVPVTGGSSSGRAPARPVVYKQSSGAFGFLFAIVLAGLVGVVVYVVMDKPTAEPPVAQQEEKPEPKKIERPRQPVAVAEVDEPEPEGFPVFAKVIQPVLEAKCTSCHGQDKAKGRLEMHSYETLAAGSGNGSILQPDPEEKARIEMIYRAELPLDDDERMPPEGEVQLTATELAVLKWWIKEGAHEDVESSEAPDEIRKKLDELVQL